MAVNISAWSIRHPLPPIVVSAALCALGILTFNKLPITQLPNVDVPVVSVTITQFGAAPAELESQVTKSVEDVVSGIEGAHHVTSSIADGISKPGDYVTLEAVMPVIVVLSNCPQQHNPAAGFAPTPIEVIVSDDFIGQPVDARWNGGRPIA